MKIGLIANPFSGGQKGKSVIPEVERRLKKEKIGYDLYITRYHRHAEHILDDIPVRDYDAVVSLGGDGTNFQVLNALLKNFKSEEIPPLGIIPVGRGNSFARDLNILTTDDGISALVGQKTRAVDVCSFTQGRGRHYFVNLTGFGFVTDMARTASKFRRPGNLSYVIGVLVQTAKLCFHDMTIEIDGNRISAKNCFVEFCNSRYTGGSMLMAPDAKIDDGFFDVVVTGPIGRMRLLATLPKIFKGTHGENPAVQFFRARKATVTTMPAKVLLPDGEIFGTTPTEINIHPEQVRYFC